MRDPVQHGAVSGRPRAARQAGLEDRVGEVVRDARSRAGTAGTPGRGRAGARRAVNVSRVTTSAVYPAALARSRKLTASVLVVRPVQLEPARPVAVRLGDLLDGVRGRRAQHHRHALGRGRPGGGELAVGVQDRLHADRARAGPGPASRCRAPRPTGRARRRPAQHPRHDPPPVERLPVGPRGRAGAGRARDVPERLHRQRPLGEALQPRQIRGQRGPHVAEALQVDRILEVGQRAQGNLRGRETSSVEGPSAGGRSVEDIVLVRSSDLNVPGPRR